MKFLATCSDSRLSCRGFTGTVLERSVMDNPGNDCERLLLDRFEQIILAESFCVCVDLWYCFMTPDVICSLSPSSNASGQTLSMPTSAVWSYARKNDVLQMLLHMWSTSPTQFDNENFTVWLTSTILNTGRHWFGWIQLVQLKVILTCSG